MDTNIWVYATDLDAGGKCETSRRPLRTLLLRDEVVLSHQIAREFVAVVIRPGKNRVPLSEAEAWRFVRETVLPYCSVKETTSLHEVAHGLRVTRQLSPYDSFMVAAAIVGDCETIYTEDLQHGQIIDGIRIENTFLTP